MRLAVLAAALALAPSPLVAQAVSTQPLAANEVLLEVGAFGVARSRADVASLSVPLIGSGATLGAARAQQLRLAERIRAAAQASGVAAEDVVVNVAPYHPAMGIMPPGPPAGDGGAGVQAQVQIRANVEVRIRDFGRIATVERALREAGADAVNGPNYALANDSDARRRARADAIANARADAESYAASLGMRIARIVRVTERHGTDMVSLMLGNPNLAREMGNPQSDSDPNVETRALVGIDFALAPR